MYAFLQYLKSGTNQAQESARALNYLYLTETMYKVPADKSIWDIIITYHSCLKTKGLLKSAISLRQKFKDLHISEDEIDDGSFFKDDKNFNSDPGSYDVLLWVAHVSEVISLDPAKPFITMRSNGVLTKGHPEIGRAWPREKISAVTNRFEKFYYDTDHYAYPFYVGGTKMLKSRLSSAFFPVDFFENRCELILKLINEFFKSRCERDSKFENSKFESRCERNSEVVSRCCFDLDLFTTRCAICMIFDTQPNNSSSILNILRILIPTVIPDVVLRYIEFSMKAPSMYQVKSQLAQSDIFGYKLNIDYSNINKLYHEDAIAYIRELMGNEKPITRERLTGYGDITKKLTSELARNHFEPPEKRRYVYFTVNGDLFIVLFLLIGSVMMIIRCLAN